MTSPHEMVNVRYMVDDVQAAVDFYTGHLGFALRFSAAPAFADVSRGNLRLLLAGVLTKTGKEERLVDSTVEDRDPPLAALDDDVAALESGLSRKLGGGEVNCHRCWTSYDRLPFGREVCRLDRMHSTGLSAGSFTKP